ncbi:hypothetical protein [Nocardiopsis kunsanensis]|uniref:Uncharacterized protein n=1 Tax=Nocardiopsis kunsanensis TaxID=141693 RepID=A0A918X706_9ACTN|nr:hypothetical protein [Nocardiopsis kunsanensis]GHD16324.1 hypothetical protein GCM10007147_04290 [Nocardiopsis kunsanensis]
MAEAVLKVLDHRRIGVPGEVRAHILACRDHDRLLTCFDAALVVDSPEELLGD